MFRKAIILLMLSVFCAIGFSTINLISSEKSSIVVNIECDPIISENNEYVKVYQENADYIDIPGSPRIPVYRELILIPDGADISIREVSKISETVSISGLIEPALEFLPKDFQDFAEPPNPNSMIYRKNKFFNYESVKIIDRGKIHGNSYVIAEFHPVAYNPVESKIEIRYDMTLEITFHGGTERNNRYVSRVFDPIIADIALNPQEVVAHPEVPIGYLVICHPSLQMSIEPLVTWRREMGYHVMMYTPEELGGTVTSIYSSIQDIYRTSEVTPDYLLLVGDTDVLPCFSAGGAGTETDIEYGVLDGDDYIPDILIGRISVASQIQAARIAERVVQYEKEALPTDAYTNHTLFGTTDDGSFHDVVHRVHSHVISTYLEPHGVSHIELDGLSAVMSDVVAVIDSGTNFFYYYGHGSSAGLAAPRFDYSGIDACSNEGMYPFIVGNACTTNEFMTRGESWGEALLRREGKGAIAYIGASNSTYWYPDSVWEIETFNALYEQGYSDVYGICYYALIETDISFPSYGHYFFDVYNLIGDPATRLWREFPKVLEVEHSPVYSMADTNVIEITVTDEGSPVVDALVCISSDDVHKAAYTDGFGIATINHIPDSPDTLVVTATAQTYIPYQGEMTPYSPDEPLLYISYFAAFDSSVYAAINNENGNLDVGETIKIDLTVVNFGTDAADVNISLPDFDCFDIETPEVFIGVIVSMDTAYISYMATILPTSGGVPIYENYPGVVSIEITSSPAYEFIYGRNITVSTPELRYSFFEMSDVEGGDGDMVPESGEEISLMLNMLNFGKTPLDSVTVTIDIIEESSSPTDFMELATLPVFTDIPGDIDGPEASEYDGEMTLNILSNPPEGTSVLFSMEQTARGLTFTDTFRVWFNPESYYEDFSDSEGWILDGPSLAEWRLTELMSSSPPYSLNNTAEGAGYCGGDLFYFENLVNNAISEPFVIPPDPVVSFFYKIYTPVRPRTEIDSGWVELIVQTDTIVISEGFTGKTDDWQFIRLDLPSGYHYQDGKLMFRFATDGANERKGWFIDDVFVKTRNSPVFGGASVFPKIGDLSTDFQFEITIQKEDAVAPYEVLLVIDDRTVPMVRDGGLLATGAKYRATTTMPSMSVSDIHFEIVFPEFGEFRYPVEGSVEKPKVMRQMFFTDFEDSDGRFYEMGSGEWVWADIGAEDALSGSKVWATLTDEMTGYEEEAHSRLNYLLDLSEYTNPHISFWAKYEFAVGSSSGMMRDGGNVKVGPMGESVTLVYPEPFYDGKIISDSNPMADEPAYGELESDEWKMYVVDISEYEGDTVYVNFCLGTNNTENNLGWYIDDVAFWSFDESGISEHIETPETMNLSVYPNPFNTTANISVDINGNRNIVNTLTISNIHGEIVYSQVITGSISEIMWNAEAQPTGIYMVTVENEKSSISEKVILIK